MMRSVSRPILCALMFAPLAFGDRIVSGWIQAMREDFPGGAYSIQGRDFDFAGGIYWGDWPRDQEVPSEGGSVRTRGLAGDFGVASGTYKGKYYPRLLLTSMWAETYSWFDITGPEIAIDAPGRYRAPFEIGGWLCGIVEPSGWATPCEVYIELQGSGTTTLFVSTRADDLYGDRLWVTGARYDFTVPEPGTFALVVTGLGAVAGATWRRRVLRS